MANQYTPPNMAEELHLINEELKSFRSGQERINKEIQIYLQAHQEMINSIIEKIREHDIRMEYLIQTFHQSRVHSHSTNCSETASITNAIPSSLSTTPNNTTSTIPSSLSTTPNNATKTIPSSLSATPNNTTSTVASSLSATPNNTPKTIPSSLSTTPNNTPKKSSPMTAGQARSSPNQPGDIVELSRGQNGMTKCWEFQCQEFGKQLFNSGHGETLSRETHAWRSIVQGVPGSFIVSKTLLMPTSNSGLPRVQLGVTIESDTDQCFRIKLFSCQKSIPKPIVTTLYVGIHLIGGKVLHFSHKFRIERALPFVGEPNTFKLSMTNQMDKLKRPKMILSFQRQN